MITVVFQAILAAVIMILCYKTVLYRLFIAQKMSDKLYKNFGLAFLCLIVYISCTATMILGYECDWKMDAINSGELELLKAYEAYAEFISSLNSMTINLVIGIVFYGLTLLLVKNILKDIEIEFSKPKQRWGSIN